MDTDHQTLVHANLFFCRKGVWCFPAPPPLEQVGQESQDVASEWSPTRGGRAGNRQPPIQPKIKPAPTTELMFCAHLKLGHQLSPKIPLGYIMRQKYLKPTLTETHRCTTYLSTFVYLQTRKPRN